MNTFVRLTICSLLISFTCINADKKPQLNNKMLTVTVQAIQTWFTLQVAPHNQLFNQNHLLPAPEQRLALPAPRGN